MGGGCGEVFPGEELLYWGPTDGTRGHINTSLKVVCRLLCVSVCVWPSVWLKVHSFHSISKGLSDPVDLGASDVGRERRWLPGTQCLCVRSQI